MNDQYTPQTDVGSEENFGPAFDDATMYRMEEGANKVGIMRRTTLSVMTRSADQLAKASVDDPETYVGMYELVKGFREHAEGLLEVAKAAHLRLALSDLGPTQEQSLQEADALMKDAKPEGGES